MRTNMSTAYGYDGKGNLHPFFFLMMLMLILIPTTIVFARHHFKNLRNPVTTVCTCRLCTEKAQKFKRRRRKSYLKPTFLMHLVLLCGGWFTILQLTTTIQSSPQVQIWDPFRVLELSTFSSTTHIKRQYKRKSLKFHPDKRSKDVSKEEAEAVFIDITKAYKALTDPIVRENFLISGSPDGSQEPKFGVALPNESIKKETWMMFLFGYITIFAIIIPSYFGLRWSQSQKTNQGLYCRTGFKFFSAAVHRKKLESTEIITLLSECDEIVEAVRSCRKLEIKKLMELYLTLPSKREMHMSSNPPSSGIAEMLLYAHLNRCSLLSPSLESLQERILTIYPFLADQFLRVLAQVKCSDAMKSTIYVIQAIKQAAIPNTPTKDSHAIPRICIWNSNVRVVGESQIFTDSRVMFWCHAYLHDSNTEFIPFEVQMENSDDEEGDVDVLMSRKKQKNDGDEQELPPAHTPYYPEYCKPKWYMFSTSQSQGVTLPLSITNIPYSDSGLQPRRIKFNFYTPNTPGIFKIKLYIMSDTYMGVDWETEMVLNIVARKGRKALNYFTEDEYESGTGRINKALMDKVLLQLPASASEDEMEAKLEAVITQFLKEKRNKLAKRQKALHKIQDESSLKEDKSKDIVKPAVDKRPSANTCSDHKMTNSEDVKLLSKNDSPQTVVEQSHSAYIKAEAKRQAHLMWQRVYGRKPILCDALEKIIPDTLATSRKWVEMDSCDPEKDYVSEWKLKGDCEDDKHENWDDEKGRFRGKSDIQEFRQETATL